MRAISWVSVEPDVDDMGLSPGRCELQNFSDHAGDAFPVFGFGGELFLAALGDRVKLRFAIIFGDAPGSGDPLFLDETNQAEVDGALIDGEGFGADLLDAAGDAVAVHGAHGVEG